MIDHDEYGTPKRIKFDTHKNPHDDADERSKDSSLPDGPYQASGVKSTLHGVIYQLKLLMLFALRGKEKGYDFRLATEMDDAEKFDDVVFQYKTPSDSTKYYRFLQAKHIQEDSKKITGMDLLTESDDKFSLQKYFLSYCKIKQKPEFQKGVLQDFTICTNIGFNFDSNFNISILKKLSYGKPLYFEPICKEDDILNIGGARYRFVSTTYPNQRQELVSELTKLFRKTSEFKKLATALAKHLLNKKSIGLDNAIFKEYQDPLAWYVIDIRNQKLAKRFLDGNLSDRLFPGANSFRTILREAVEQYLQELEELKVKHPEKLTERDKEILGKDNLRSVPPSKKFKLTFQKTDTFWNEMAQLQLNLSNGFKKILTLDLDPQLSDTFTQEMMNLFNSTTITEIHVQQRNTNRSEILNSEITKLAGHVLVKINEVVGFSNRFLNGDQLAGNLEDFRTKLMAKFKVKDNKAFRDKLNHYTFKITDFQTCQEKELLNLLDKAKPLPNDEISNDDVEAFLDQLVFAVNQPNEEKLSKLITNEIGEEFNLIDADLITNDFQNKLLNWMKTKQGPNEYISANSNDHFFREVKEKIAQLVLIGPTSEYTKKLREIGISFKPGTLPDKLRAFLTSDPNSIKKSVLYFVTPPQATILGSIKVHQILREIPEYKGDGSYIFIRLNSLLRLETEVSKAFKKKETRLLIVECKPQKRPIDSLYNNLQNLTRLENKQLLLITPDGDSDFSALNNKDCEVYTDKDPQFRDLDSLSQNNFLSKAVTFQGEKIILNKLIDPTDENAKQIIDLETLMKIINGDEVTIGSKLKDLGEINDYYIPRTFNRQVTFDKGKIKEDIISSYLSDFFVISGTDSGIPGNNKKIYVFDKNNQQAADNKFQKLCDQNTGANIHWLKSESGKLIWRQSTGSISNLVKYRTEAKTPIKGLPEEKYLEGNESKIVIIADTAGMGKSTVLTSLSGKIKNHNSSQWVIRIDLNDYSKTLSKEAENRKTNKPSFSNQDVDDVVKFLLNDLLASREQSKLRTLLEKVLFESSFSGQGKVTLIFDGFDEISPDYQDEVMDMLEALKKSKVEKIYVTTRPNMRELLEKKLEVFSHVLEPFNNPDQIKFLTDFWTKKLELKYLNQERKVRLNIYAESLIKKFSTSINDREQIFIGIPLQTMMLAEIFQEKKEGTLKEWGEWEGCKEFLTIANTGNNPKLPEQFNVLGLYEHFIDRKFYDFYLQEKHGRDFTKSREKKLAEENYKIFKKRHETLALSALFSDEDLKQNILISVEEIEQLNNSMEDIKNVESNEGIVDKIIDGKPHFIHRTFAEYFASFPLAEKMRLDPKTICPVVDSLVDNTSPVFISSIAKILNNQKVRIESITVLDFLTKHKDNYLKFFNALLDIDYQDDLGKTSLHYAVQDNCKDTIKDVLEYKRGTLGKVILKHGKFINKEYENSYLVKFVNQKDNNGKTALDYADNFKLDTELSFELLLNGASIDGLTQEYLKKLIQYMLYTESSLKFDDENHIFDGSILGAYANQDNKFRPIEEKLLLQAPDAVSDVSESKDYRRLLSYFFLHGRVKVIDTLLRSLNDEEKRKRLLNAKDNGYTPLDRVNYSDQLNDHDRLKITKYLLGNGGTKVNAAFIGYSSTNTENFNSFITKILIAAAQHGHIKTFQHFIGQEDPNCYHIHLYEAAVCQQFNIIKFLLEHHREKIKDDGNTALHAAVDSGASLKIIKYCIDNGENINAQNDRGWTPLRHAISKRRLNIIKYLVDHKADVNIADEQGYTVLYHAIESDQRDTIKYLLLECKAEIDLDSELIRNKVGFFRDPYEFNLNHADERGMPRLQRAIQSPDLEWAKFIIRNGGNVNIEDQYGKTPLHVASQFGKVEIVKLLLQYGAMYDKADKSHRKPIDFPHNPEISLILNTLHKLFDSQDLNKSLKELYLERHNWRDWVHNDVWDPDNPMLFLLNARNHEGKSLSHIAANTNSLSAFNTLIKFNYEYLQRKLEFRRYPKYKDYQSTSIDAIDSQGNTPLHLAAQEGHKDMVSLLLKEGVIFNAENLQRKTPEELAKNNGHDNIAKLMQSTKNLFIAIEQNSFVNAKSYINDGAFINAKDKNGKTPLHFASSFGQSDIVKFLLAKRPNIESIVVDNRTALHFAAENNKIEIVKLLLKHGAIFDAKDAQDKAPFDFEKNESVDLLNAINKIFNDIQSDNPQVIIDGLEMLQKRYEIDISTVINARDTYGNTMLHYAAESNEFNIVKLLLENGAVFNAKNKLKHTAEHTSRRSQDITVLLKSIEKIFNGVHNIYQEKDTVTEQIIINVRNDQGMTLLHMAAISGKSDIVRFIVGHGADVNSVNMDGKTPLDFVSKLELLAKWLIEHGAKANVIDNDGITVLHETPIEGLSTEKEEESV